MKILLDKPEEVDEWLAMREAKKQPLMLSEFLPFDKLPDFATHPELLPPGCKLPDQSPNGMIANWPSHHKAEIMAMYAVGKFPREIAQELGMNVSSVKHLVYAEKAKARKKELENYPSHEATDWIQAASQKLAANGSTEPVVIPHKNCESFSRTITEALREMVGRDCSVVFIMTALNQEFGTHFTKDDIVQMRSEL